MSGRRRRGRATHAGNPATAAGRIHQGGGGHGERGSSGEQSAADAPTVGASEGVGGGGRDVRTPTAATPDDGGSHLGAEGGEGGSSGEHSVVDASMVGGGDGVGGGGGGRDVRTPTASTPDNGGLRLGAEDGEEGTDALLPANAIDGVLHLGADGQPSTAAGTAEEMQGRKKGCFLMDAVLKWRIGDVMDGNFFKEKVHKIPPTFTSVQQYLEIYASMLLEESRADIQLGLIDLPKRPTYHALAILQTADPYVFFIDIDLKKTGNCSHVAQDGDLFLLSTQPHGELGHASVCFAIAIEIGNYSCFQRGFRVLVSEYYKDVNFQAIKHVSFLTNIMGGITLSKAMTSVGLGGSAAVESIIWIDEKEVCSCSELVIDEISPPNKFNDNQKNALKCILSKLRCPHINAPEILWGPPGSGKTEVAATILHTLFSWKFRVLVCVPGEKDIGRFLHKFQTLFPLFNLSDILVLNDMDSVGKCNDFAEMSLETRTQELYCCTYIWRSWLKELCFVLEMKPYCQDSCHHEGPICKENNLLIFCLESFREKISALILDLKECSKDLIRSLSGKCLCELDVLNIKKLMTELSQFKVLVLNDSLTSSDVQWAFGFPSYLHLVSEVAKRDIAESVNAKRKSCLQLMEILIDSFELPQLEDRKELEDFYIGHSRVIICTPFYSSRLLQLKLTLFDTLLVDDASQIKESDLLIPLAMAPKNVVLFGDHLHLQPVVKSKVCKENGYASSLFERLLRLSSKRMELTKQYVMHHSLSLFVCDKFYEGKLEDAGNVCSDDYNKQLMDESKVASYGFFNIMDVNELRIKEKGFVECAVIIFLLQMLCKGLKNETEKVNVGVLCLCTSRVDTMKNRLDAEYGSHGRINLEVSALDNSNEDWYDIVILSSVFDSNSEIPEGNRINTALTKSRHCLWIIGEANKLIEIGGTWEALVCNAMDRHCFGKLTSSRLSNVMKKLEMNDQKRLTATIASTGNILRKPGQEWTWNGRPNNTKNIVGSLRDQKNSCDMCTLQTTLTTTQSLNKYECSCLDPPQDFLWELCFKDLESKYEKVADKKIASEEIGKKRGKCRQETALEIAKTQGIIGRYKTETEELERLFKLESYERVDTTLKAEETEALVEAGSIMACNFRLSRNYFRLRPGDVYVYDRARSYIHATSGMPISHAVTAVGHGHGGQEQSPSERRRTPVRHVHMQNSQGGSSIMVNLHRGPVLESKLAPIPLLYHTSSIGFSNEFRLGARKRVELHGERSQLNKFAVQNIQGR